MHIECKRQANTISFQSRSDLPSHPVTSLSPICKYRSCGSLVALLNRLASVSSHQVPPDPQTGVNSFPFNQCSRWLMGYSSGNVFSVSLAPAKWQAPSTSRPARQQHKASFVNWLTNWGLLIFVQWFSREWVLGLDFNFRKYVAHYDQ